MLMEHLNKDIIDYMMFKNTDCLTILKTLKADIQKVSIDTKKEINDEMVIDVVAKSVKQLYDVLDIYTNANAENKMEDKINETKKRIDLLSRYLPLQASEEEVVATINVVKEKLGATTKKDMGKMMKELTPMFKGSFDSKKLSQIVSSMLK